jgi:translation initiation factor 5B
MLIIVSSRLIYAIARDDSLPMGRWVSTMTNDRPRNAVIVIYVVSAVLLCTIIPSAVAFTSIVSVGAAPVMASYFIIALSRLTITPDRFVDTPFYLGRFRRVLFAAVFVFTGLVFSVSVFVPGVGE